MYSSKGLFIKIKLVALRQEILDNDIVYNDDFTICEHIEFIECKKHDKLYFIYMFGQNIIYDGFRQRAYFDHSYINI